LIVGTKFIESLRFLYKTILNYNVADPGYGAFLTPGSGKVKKSRSGSVSGMNIPDHISESLETIFWVKNT
jgi:hypothetical protein